MLAPEARTVAFELLRPPAGHRLDFALLTTFTLDLEALLSLPLAVLAQADESLEDLIADPVRLQQGLREAAGRVHLFVDAGGIAIPRAARALYALLESSVHPARAPGGGIFHPKVWVARFTAVETEDGTQPPLLRIVVLSRNLTFDRAWDAALASEARPARGQRATASRPLRDFTEALPKWATEQLEPRVAEQVRNLADEVGRCRFPAPDGFEAPVEFHAPGRSGRPWRPAAGSRALAVAPFVNRTALDEIVAASGNGTDNVLISREEELDALPDDALESWQKVLVLSDAAQDEVEDAAGEPKDAAGALAESEPGGSAPDAPEDRGGAPDASEENRGGGVRPSGLHAKLIAVEHRWDVTWYVGSANLTKAAFTGRNVELLAAIKGRKGRKGGVSGHGIDRFLEGFEKLCARYRRSATNAEDAGVVDARQRIEKARGLLVDADLRVTCSPAGDDWRWAVDGNVELPGDVTAAVWPVSLAEKHARPLGAAGTPPVWTLPITQLTAFVAFRLRVAGRTVDDVRMTLKLPAAGLPEESERMHHVLAALIDSPQRFLQFLRALLGGLDRLTGWARDEGGETGSGAWATSLAGETILDDLLRAASRDPASLKPARRLIGDLRKTEQGRRIVPDDLFAVWTAVEGALRKDQRS